MKKLSIEITKAQIVSFSVTTKKDKPALCATIALMTAGGKIITTYSVDSESWDEKDKVDIPINALPLIGDLARILEEVVVKHCKLGQKALPEPEEIEAD